MSANDYPVVIHVNLFTQLRMMRQKRNDLFNFQEQMCRIDRIAVPMKVKLQGREKIARGAL